MSNPFHCLCPNLDGSNKCGRNLIFSGRLLTNCSYCGWEVCLREVLDGSEDFLVCVAENVDGPCHKVSSTDAKFCAWCGKQLSRKRSFRLFMKKCVTAVL